MPEVKFPEYDISEVFKFCVKSSHNSVRDGMFSWLRLKRIKTKTTKSSAVIDREVVYKTWMNGSSG